MSDERTHHDLNRDNYNIEKDDPRTCYNVLGGDVHSQMLIG
jgi:hypothetical protein